MMYALQAAVEGLESLEQSGLCEWAAELEADQSRTKGRRTNIASQASSLSPAITVTRCCTVYIGCLLDCLSDLCSKLNSCQCVCESCQWMQFGLFCWVFYTQVECLAHAGKRGTRLSV